jgi:hypothetical protein
MGATFMRRQRFLFAALGLLTLWRWALLPTLELSPDEALAGTRVKHGMGRISEASAARGVVRADEHRGVWRDGEFGVRFFAPVIALAASLAVWRFTRGLFDPHDRRVGGGGA